MRKEYLELEHEYLLLLEDRHIKNYYSTSTSFDVHIIHSIFASEYELKLICKLKLNLPHYFSFSKNRRFSLFQLIFWAICNEENFTTAGFWFIGIYGYCTVRWVDDLTMLEDIHARKAASMSGNLIL